MRNPILEKEKQNALLTGNLGKKEGLLDVWKRNIYINLAPI